MSGEPDTLDEANDRVIAQFERVIIDREAQRDRYKAALRKIATWKGYTPRTCSNDKDGEPVLIITRYEEGANDMLETLAGFAKEALA